MSSRLHNKWHRHNHHTDPTADSNLPDSGHDPIASPDSPFQGDFVLSGSLSALQTSLAPTIQVVGQTAIQATGNVLVNGTLTTTTVNVTNIRAANKVPRPNPIEATGDFLEVQVAGETFYIRLWKNL